LLDLHEDGTMSCEQLMIQMITSPVTETRLWTAIDADSTPFFLRLFCALARGKLHYAECHMPVNKRARDEWALSVLNSNWEMCFRHMAKHKRFETFLGEICLNTTKTLHGVPVNPFWIAGMSYCVTQAAFWLPKLALELLVNFYMFPKVDAINFRYDDESTILTHFCDTAAIVATRVALNEDDVRAGLIDEEHSTYMLFHANLSEYLHCIDILLRRGDVGPHFCE